MTFYINGKFLCRQTTGTQTYALSMLKAMKQQNIDFQILVPVSASISNVFSYKKIGFFSNLNLWEQISLPWFLYGKKNCLLLNFSNSAPLFVSHQIVTIHDLAFEQRNASWFSFSFKYWYRFLVPKICRKVKYVLTVSQFSKNELCKYYALPEKKVKIIPNVMPDMEEIAERQIKEEYLLLFGAENPRKNAQWLLDQLSEIENRGLKLLLVSAQSNTFKKLNIEKHPSVMFLNYVSEPRYYSLIKHAKALLYLSSYEGFGIPVLQALCLKTPVICNELSVFKDSFGELPIYLKLDEANALSGALDRLKNKTISESEIHVLQSKYSYATSGLLISKLLDSIS